MFEGACASAKVSKQATAIAQHRERSGRHDAGLANRKLQSARNILAEWKDLCENVGEETFGDEYQDDDKVNRFNATKLWTPLAWDYEAGEASTTTSTSTSTPVPTVTRGK